MAAPNFSDFELKAEFRGDYIVHTADGLKEVWGQGELIGRGTFGKVFVQQRKGGRQLRAVKEVALDPLTKAGISQELLVFVTTKDHDDLFVKFLGWYKNSHDMFFVMEYLKDGDLGRYMAQDPQRAKENAKDITTQILRGLEVLHKNKICHRDLKPPNVLIASLTPVWVKIADFGVAKQTANSTAKSGWGTDNYRAPEAFGGLLPNNRPKPRGLSYALDIWSLGSLLHELLTSQTPFLDVTIDQTETGVAKYTSPQHVIDMGIFLKYCHGMIGFPIEVLQGSQVSKEGIDFVKSLLVASPEKRPTAASALQNPWLNRYIYNPPPQLIANAANISGVFQPPKTTEDASVEKSTLLRFQHVAEIAELRAALFMLNVRGSWSTSNTLLLLKNVESGNTDNVAILLKSKIGINNTSCQKGFRLAVKLGHFHIVKLFLRNKINVETLFGNVTALQMACADGYTEIVKLLLDSKADVNAKGGGRTALQAAAGSEHIDIVKLLLDSKADVNAKAVEGGGRTALQAAARSGHIDIVKLLLENKADVNAQASEYGLTALQEAAGSGHIDIVKLLLDSQADIHARGGSVFGSTALELGRITRNRELISVLEAAERSSPRPLTTL